MAYSTSSIYPQGANTSWSIADGDGGTAGPIKTANTAKDGTGTINTIFTAGANGSNVYFIRFVPQGNNTASVARLFINNGSTHATVANNVPWKEISLPATTLTEVAAHDELVIPCQLFLPAGYKLLATIGTTVADGWRICVEGRDY